MNLFKQGILGFGNHVLYEPCSDQPSYTKSYEVIGKVWLIGRSIYSSLGVE